MKNPLLNNLYFGKICPQELADNTDEQNKDCDCFINSLEPQLKEIMEEYLSGENLKFAKLEAEAFAMGCSFATKFIFECFNISNNHLISK